MQEETQCEFLGGTAGGFAERTLGGNTVGNHREIPKTKEKDLTGSAKRSRGWIKQKLTKKPSEEIPGRISER